MPIKLQVTDVSVDADIVQAVEPTITDGDVPKFVPVSDTEVAPDADEGEIEVICGVDAVEYVKVPDVDCPQELITRLLDSSDPTGVTHLMAPGETDRIEQDPPPMVTVVKPEVSQNPLPIISISCPPHVEPEDGEIESMAILLLNRPAFDKAFPCPSILIMILYSPAGNDGGMNVKEVELMEVITAWNVPSVRRAISIKADSLSDLLCLKNSLSSENSSSKRLLSMSLHFVASVMHISINNSASSSASSSSSSSQSSGSSLFLRSNEDGKNETSS